MSDPFDRFRAVTNARIGLGRAGDALPTRPLLDFALAHARARDAVHGEVDWGALAAALAPHSALAVASQAADKATYLRRPDLGRRLSPESRTVLPAGPFDLVLVVADGLSASAVAAQAAPVVHATLRRLPDWSVGPVVLARGARVALGDEIGETMGSGLVAVLIGERPGLSSQDSLGVYVTYGPLVGRTDAERNCISNIHGRGLSTDAAAARLVWLLEAARSLRLTGVGLKEDAPTPLAGGQPPTALE